MKIIFEFEIKKIEKETDLIHAFKFVYFFKFKVDLYYAVFVFSILNT